MLERHLEGRLIVPHGNEKEEHMNTVWKKNIGCIALALCLLFCTTSFTFAGTTERVSVATGGAEWNNFSSASSISADGRYVAFDAYPYPQIFGSSAYVHDRQTGITEMVSLSSQGTPANGISIIPSISADGRYVAFLSYATNLVSGDTNALPDVFVRDRQTGVTERVNVSTSGAQDNGGAGSVSISADGRYVAFHTYGSNLVPGDTNGPGDASRDVFVHDRVTGATERVSVSSAGTQGNNGSTDPAISADGRYVAFTSYASNLVSGDTNGAADVFVHDRQTNSTERVSVSGTGGQGNGTSYSPSMSADGQFIVFLSTASNLVPGDTNGYWDVFVHDRQTGTTERVNVSSSGGQANNSSFRRPSISGDGRYVVFDSWATNLVDRDANAYIADIFLHDRQTGTTELVSVSSGGEQGNGNSYSPSISTDGNSIVFSSWSTNLVSGDTNGIYDVFVRSR